MQGSSGQDEGVNLAERLEALLLQRGKLRAGDVARVKHVQREQGEEQPFTRLLVRLGMVGERDIAEVLSELFSVPLAKPDDYADVNVLNGELSQRFLREHLVVPIQVNGDQVTLAMAEPQDEATRRAIAFATGKTILPWVGVYSEIENAIERMSGDQRSKMGQILEEVGADEDFSEEDVAQLKDLASEAPVIRLVNLLIQRATEAGASDIHIEPFEGQLKVRVRVDGILQDIEAPPAHLGTAVISRVKIMARLNIAERRLPQDGRIRLRMQGKDLDIRVSTVPTLYGESVVLRLLNQQNVALDFKLLGFPADTRKSLSEALAAPHGMILVTGPTGSGKTTTLYAALRILNTHERKILTVEDPVEYQLEGINQIQVKPDIGLTFANALRSILRQDPDVIMVGEMRDLETARICVQSALTGHLVLSTLHTNDAASSVTRLLEMGVEDYLLTSTLTAVLAQRLVRVLCDCRVPYEAMPELIEQLKLRRFTPEGPVVLHRPAGCDACNGTGYRGRTIIQELMVLDDELRRLVLREADAGQLHDAAVAAGMRTMYQDGLRKAVEGITTIEETVRVTQEM